MRYASGPHRLRSESRPARQRCSRPDETDSLVVAEPAPAFLVRVSAERPDDLIPGLIPRVGSGAIHGQPRTLKSVTFLDITISAATATPCFGLDHLTPPQAVVAWYITRKTPRSKSAIGCRRSSRAAAVRSRVACTCRLQRAILLDDPEWQARVIAYAHQMGVALTIVDPIRASSACVDAGPKELAPFAAFARRFRRETGSVLWLGHHAEAAA